MEIVIAVIVGLIVGFGLAWLLAGSRSRAQAQAAGAQRERDLATLERDLAERHRAELASAREQTVAELTQLREQFSVELTAAGEQAAAARAEAAGAASATERLLAENTELRNQAKRDQNVLRAFEPVQVKLRDVQEHVARLERERTEQYGQLAAQLRSSAETDEHLRAQTQQLVGALRTTSARGQWGEFELRRVLEVSGMLAHVDFGEQEALTSPSDPTHVGKPDVVVHLPGGKHLAIDAKVPLTAFLEASAVAGGSADEQAQRQSLLSQHAKALRGHVDTLASRQYWELLEVSPEFTVLFLPSENLLGEALRAQPDLMEFALVKKVALATPSTLMALLKTVATIWQQAVVTDEARELLALGRNLYQHLNTLGGHTARMGRALESAVKNYNQMIGTLERSVLSTARKFPTFDATSLDAPPEIAEEKAQVRQLTKAELTEPESPVLPAGTAEAQPNDGQEVAEVVTGEPGGRGRRGR